MELGRVTDRKPPFKYSAIARVWFSDTDAQGVVYYGRYLPYFDHARTEYHRHLGHSGTWSEAGEFVMRASNVEYHAPARFDDLLEIFVRTARIGRTSATFECAAYRMDDDLLMVTATQTMVLVDLAARRPAEIPQAYRELIRGFEGEDLEAVSAHSGALKRSSACLNRGGEADDVLRQVVAILHERLGHYIRISFVEADSLVPGPAAGDETETTAFPIAFQGSRVADLEAGGELTEEDRAAPGTRRDPRLSVRPRRLGHRRRGVDPVAALRSCRRRARPEMWPLRTGAAASRNPSPRSRCTDVSATRPSLDGGNALVRRTIPRTGDPSLERGSYRLLKRISPARAHNVPVKILVVDDEPAVRDSLRRALQLEGYEVELAGDGAEALDRVAAQNGIDAVVLDVSMPRLDGLEACRRLRRDGNSLPVLMLTARDAVTDRVAGLDAGADDYVVKPFALEELLARLRALLRRLGPQDGDVLRFADISLDPSTREVERSGEPIELTRTEFALLELFLLNPRQVLTRSVIFERVWGYDFGFGSNSLDVYIGYLRRKTEEGDKPRLIQTIRGVGYALREA